MAEVESRARRILRRLSGGARLKRCGAAYVILGAKGPKIVLSTPFVAVMQARGWLREEDGDLVPSETGREWLNGGDTAFADSHRVLDTRRIRDGNGRECYVVVNAAESPLALLRRRRLVSARQFEAGERLRRDFTIGEFEPRMAIDYAMAVGHGLHQNAPLTETVVAARRRFSQAMRAVGPGLSDVLFDVCCFLKGMDDGERSRRWPRSSLKVVLCIALDRLAEHYRTIARRRERTRFWRTPDPPSPRGVEEGGGRV